MKKTSLIFVCLAAAVAVYFQIQPATAQAPIPIPSVWKQSSSPGTTQSGNFNINGIGLMGVLSVNAAPSGAQSTIGSAGATGLYVGISPGGYNGVYANLMTDNTYPAIVGFAAGNFNAGVWGQNNNTGAAGFLGYGTDGLVASGASNGWAGIFYGNVTASGQVVMNAPLGTSRLEVSEADISKVGVRSMNHNVGSSAFASSYYRPGAEFSGRNGLIGQSTDTYGYGLVGLADGTNGIGSYAAVSDTSGPNYAAYGYSGSPNGYGMYSQGRFAASGTKSFRIDHPRDPENMYLQHYCTEGEKPLNVYQGEVTTDATGYATVALPDYFDDINRNARVLLTVVDMSDSDDFALVKQVSPVQNASFRIRTSTPNTRVAWEVKGERWDLYVRAYGAPVEVQKPANERGTYQHPELYGKGLERRAVQTREKRPVEVRRPVPDPNKRPKAIFGPGSVSLGK